MINNKRKDKKMNVVDTLMFNAFPTEDEGGIFGGGGAFMGNIKVIREKETDKFLYKYVDPSDDGLKKLTFEIEELLRQGQNEILLPIGMTEGKKYVGLGKGDFDKSIEVIEGISKVLGAVSSISFRKNVSKKKQRDYGEILIRKDSELTDETDFVDIRIAIVGNVDSGKSTLIGVLTTGNLDNGRGEARKAVFNFKHEQETGRTSSVSLQILGYTSGGDIVNYKQKHGKMPWTKICKSSSKIITFIDLAGHEKYLKTTVYGMTGGVADYACLVVGSNMGVTRMTKEHLGICLALKIPFFIIITKIDLCPENVLKNTLSTIKKILKMSGVRKMPIFVKKENEIISCVKNIGSERITPIFLVSNVTGENLDLLRKFINLLPRRNNFVNMEKQDVEFFIDSIFYVSGVGTVVSGLVNSGHVKVNDFLYIGPDGNGEYRKTQVKSIQRLRVNVTSATAGQTCTLALRKEKRNNIRKGMVLVNDKKNCKAYWEFSASVQILYHSTTIKVNYQPVIHSLNIRQSAKIIKMDATSIRTGDKAILRFRFISRPEYVKKGSKLIFREGRTKGIGKITDVHE